MKLYASEIRVGMLIEYKNDLWQVFKNTACETWQRWCFCPS